MPRKCFPDWEASRRQEETNARKTSAGLFFFLIYILFLAALGLHCGARGFSLRWLLLLWSTGSRCQASVGVARGLSSCGTWA